MVYEKLYPYQKEIVDRQDKLSSALFMDMGTGKTITSLALYEKSKKPKLLIICLVSKLYDWEDEVKENFSLKPKVLDKGTKKNLTMLDNDCLIVNYESVWRLDQTLLNTIDNEWYIIVDESHKIKNPKSKIGKFMSKLSSRTNSKCVLTGTPQSQGYIDYYMQLMFVDIFEMSLRKFEEEYCVYELVKRQLWNGGEMIMRYYNELKEYRNVRKLDNIIHTNCVFFKRDVEDDLIPQHINVKIKKHKSFDKFKKTKVFNDDIIGDTPMTLRMGLRQLCSGFIRDVPDVSKYKIQWLKDFLESYDKRVVIFYNFNMEMDAIQALCDTLKRPYSFYNGKVKDLTTFLNEDQGVAICNYGSASMGLNELVASSVSIMYSPTEDYILFTQAKKRIDRIGQVEKPLMYYLITEDSIEEAIYNALNNGQDFDDKMFNNYIL